MAKRKKYYKVVVLVTEMIPVVRKQVFVNVEKYIACENKYLSIVRRDITTTFYKESMNFEYFIKEQKRWIDDDTKIYKKATKRKG